MKKERCKIYNIAKTAQYIETILFRRPHSARANPTTLLKGNESYTRIFNKNINMHAYINSCMIYKVIDVFIKELDSNNDIMHMKYGVSMKNFTFHIMLIISLVNIQKNVISDEELAKIDTDNISKESISEAVDILMTSIQNLNDRSSTENVIGLAKLKTLTDQILLNMDKLYKK